MMLGMTGAIFVDCAADEEQAARKKAKRLALNTVEVKKEKDLHIEAGLLNGFLELLEGCHPGNGVDEICQGGALGA
jgi:hypothetical protein